MSRPRNGRNPLNLNRAVKALLGPELYHETKDTLTILQARELLDGLESDGQLAKLGTAPPRWQPRGARTWRQVGEAHGVGAQTRVRATCAALLLDDDVPSRKQGAIATHNLTGSPSSFVYIDDPGNVEEWRAQQREASSPKPATKRAPNPGPLSRRR